MQPLVHVAVGAVAGLAAALAAGLDLRRRRQAVVAGAVWGSVPDWHLALDALGVDGLARAWAGFHDSAAANLCWFHRLLDASETDYYALEDLAAVAVLLAVLVVLRSGSTAE